jgi:hypothetical protein
VMESLSLFVVGAIRGSHLDKPCSLSSVPFTSGQALIPMCSVHSYTSAEYVCTVSCLMKCQSEGMLVSVRSLHQRF